MQFDYDTVVFLGRFRPPTKAHLDVIRKGLHRAKQAVVIVGSCFEPRSVRNVWNFAEVEAMLRSALTSEENARVIICGIPDFTYANNLWVQQVQTVVAEVTKAGDTIALIGHAKDNSSFYLSLFPTWDSINVPNFGGINATDVRKIVFGDGITKATIPALEKMLLPGVIDYLTEWVKTPDFMEVKKEVEFCINYRKEWGKGPFLTADSVVLQSGHILLIQRGDYPGKGLWALPGGFVHDDETMLDAAIRELIEETEIDMPRGAIEGSFEFAMLFDDPHRDPRARIVTQAHLFDLDHEVQRRAKKRATGRGDVNTPLRLTRVVGADDAAHAEWIPLSNVNRGMMFADHYHIINKMMSQI